MKFTTIDLNEWERKDCFLHFISVAKCTYSLTVNVDITRLISFIKENNYRLYPSFTWIITKALNNHQEFKMSFDQDNNLGYYDEISPYYSVLNGKTKNMDSLYTSYDSEFKQFYKNMTEDMERYETYNSKSFPAKNFFIVSCLPWLNYTSFNVTNQGEQQFLSPMVTWGKYVKQGDKILMPLTLQVHHAVADGYHCSLFYHDVEEILQNPEAYLK
ncbi:MAG: chloramphenicol acetyltransferase CAT [Lachnospiraceae bacterium]|nr:chloramphenicol acetyltransferase CAT [Lachnospiraceae bacterium]